MISFFRKNRKTLAESGTVIKLSSPNVRYLKYALGEIALVVIGILIAMQINNWNEARKKNLAIKVYLVNLVEDLESDIEVLKKLERGSSFRYYSAQYLLEMANETQYAPKADGTFVSEWLSAGNKIWHGPIPKEYNKEFIELAMIYTERIDVDAANTSTIEELKSTGAYSNLSNDALKNALNAYYADWNFRVGYTAQEVYRQILEFWQNAFMDLGKVTSMPYLNGDPIELLANDPALCARLRAMAAESLWQNRSSKILIEKAEELQNLIKIEVAK